MTAKLVVAAVPVGLALVASTLVGGCRASEEHTGPAATPSPVETASTAPASEADQGFLYGRVTTHDGTAYQGRLRWGGDEEAFWSDTFNGFKDENLWGDEVPPERLTERRPVAVFGVELAQRDRRVNLRRPFMARFGDMARIEPHGLELRVTLKSGTVFVLDRFSADDLADGVRVWDADQGVVDLGEWRIHTIELLPTARLDEVPERLHGTLRTRHGSAFRGFIQWDRKQCVGSDELAGSTAEGGLRLRFETIRSVARSARDSVVVTLLDGHEILLSDAGASGGIYVHDRRFGRVLVPWGTFERLDFGEAGSGSGPAYDDFPPGGPLTGSVSLRDGRRLAGRLVYDLDESETTETLDAPSQGVDYMIPFGLVASIVLPGQPGRGARPIEVMLHNGEALQLEPAGDLGDRNAGMLVFGDGGERPEHVPWSEVARVDLERPSAMFPPLDES